MTLKRLLKNSIIVSSLVFILMVIFLYIIFEKRERTKNVKMNIQKIEECFKRIECLKYKITDEYLSDPGSFQTLKHINFKNEIGKVKFDFIIAYQKINKSKIFIKNPYLLNYVDSLKNLINSQVNNLDIYLSLIEKRGSELTNGIVSLLVLDGDKLQEEVKDKNPIIYKIRLLEGKAIYGGITLKLSNIDNLMQDFNNSINKTIESYINNLQELDFINRQIGWNNSEENSILYKFDENQKKVSKLLMFLKNHSNELLDKEIKLINYISILIILIFIIIYFYALNKLFKKLLIRPMGMVLKLINNINSGIFETYNYKTNVKEFNEFIVGLNKIINFQKNRIEFIKALNENKFDYELLTTENEDLIDKELQKLRHTLKISYEEKIKHDEENRIKQYVNEGIAKFSEIAHSNFGNLNKLNDIYIKELVKYLDVIQGGIYLIDDNNTNQLYLISAFAYDRKKYLTKTYQIGEGLIGTCALEKKILIIDNVPESYIKITSGLGDTPPRHLYIIPILHNNEDLIGVIEIASLKQLKDYEIEFAQQVSGILAVSIANEKINQKTKKLLEQTQEQALKMREQEEEMRQNLEELQASQEEFSRREENLKGLLNALDRSWLIAELNNKGEFLNMNLNFLIVLGKQLEEVVGKKYTDVVNGELSSKIDNNFIDEILGGKQLEHIEIIKFGKKESKLFLKFSPVYNNAEIPIKILCSGYEIFVS